LELLLTEFASLFGFLGADVGILLSLNFGLLRGAKLGEDVGSPVFREGSIVIFDCLGEVTESLI
jgi:hypothetical protein